MVLVMYLMEKDIFKVPYLLKDRVFSRFFTKNMTNIFKVKLSVISDIIGGVCAKEYLDVILFTRKNWRRYSQERAFRPACVPSVEPPRWVGEKVLSNGSDAEANPSA